MPFLGLGHAHDGGERLHLQVLILAIAKPAKSFGKSQDCLVGACHGSPPAYKDYVTGANNPFPVPEVN
jgi:hypothetical protein